MEWTIIFSVAIVCVTFSFFVIMSLRETSCKLGNHKFKPRYDKKRAPSEFTLNQNPVTAFNASEIEMLMFEKLYIYDVCERCGKTSFENIPEILKEKENAIQP